jgi:hypothetical protein
MSEINENAQGNPGTQDTGQETPGTENTTPASTSVLNLAIESVMDLIDGLHPFANITRGPLGISDSLSCEIAPSTTESVFMDKESYTPLTLALNGKHSNLQVLSDTLNNIMDTLTRLKSYPTGNGWQIVDITNGNLPRVIGREENNSWVMACDLVVKIYRKDET